MAYASWKSILKYQGLDEMTFKIPLWLKIIKRLSFCFHVALHTIRETKQTNAEKNKKS